MSKQSSISKKNSRSKFSDVFLRICTSIPIASIFIFVIALGQIPTSIFLVIVQISLYCEVMNIYKPTIKEIKSPVTWNLRWFFLFNTLFFLYGKKILIKISDAYFSYSPIHRLIQNHLMLTHAIYVFGMIFFILNLKRSNLKSQFRLYAYIHMALFFTVCQTKCIIDNVLKGLFWFVFPSILVIINDTSAYFFGRYFGHTPLIRLSPKKTVEGFILASATTLLVSLILSKYLGTFGYLTKSYQNNNAYSYIFSPKAYQLPSWIHPALRFLRLANFSHFTIYPIQFHGLILAIFASFVAPFAGFFASAVKRMFRIKDFADTFPGHGGIADRFDCHSLMGLMTYIYINTVLTDRKVSVLDVIKTMKENLSPEERSYVIQYFMNRAA